MNKYIETDEQARNWLEFKKESLIKTNNAKKAQLAKS